MFSTSLSFYHPFITEVLHGGSTWWFIKDLIPSRSVRQGFFSFFNCSSRFLSKLWSAKLYSKINMVLNTCLSWGVQAFFILHSEVQFFLPYLLRWCYVTLDNFLHVSWFICCQEWGILNPSVSSLELSWYRFHLKPSLRNVAIVVLINDPSFLLSSRREKFSSLRWSQANNCFP